MARGREHQQCEGRPFESALLGEALLTSCQPQRVLIVEDDPVSQRVLKRFVERESHPVLVAENGRQALETLRRTPCRIVITDWMMPGMDGIQLCRAIRQMDGPYTFVILLTSRDASADKVEAFEAGIDDMLSKPLDAEALSLRLKVANRILLAEETLRSQKRQIDAARQNLLSANRNLQIASRRFEGLFDNLPVACFTFDTRGLIQEWNRSAEELFGIPAFVIVQRPVWDVFRHNKAAIWTKGQIAKVLKGHGVEGREWTFERNGTPPIHLVTNLFPLSGPNGETLGGICSCVDITYRKLAEQKIADQVREINAFAASLKEQKSQLEELNSKLEHLANTDALTGLCNVRAFRTQLEREIARASETGGPISLAFMDIDHFKQYNDTFGHLAGDTVLRKVGEALSNCACPGATAARYGGEEFAILLPSATRERALEVAECCRREVERIEIDDWHITISAGVCTTEGGKLSVDAFVERADAALYHSKRMGRNRTTHVDDIAIEELPKAARLKPAA